MRRIIRLSIQFIYLVIDPLKTKSLPWKRNINNSLKLKNREIGEENDKVMREGKGGSPNQMKFEEGRVTFN